MKSVQKKWSDEIEDFIYTRIPTFLLPIYKQYVDDMLLRRIKQTEIRLWLLFLLLKWDHLFNNHLLNLCDCQVNGLFSIW